jgi:hypothetical protein
MEDSMTPDEIIQDINDRYIIHIKIKSLWLRIIMKCKQALKIMIAATIAAVKVGIRTIREMWEIQKDWKE